MRKSRFTESQIVGILKEGEALTPRSMRTASPGVIPEHPNSLSAAIDISLSPFPVSSAARRTCDSVTRPRGRASTGPTL